MFFDLNICWLNIQLRDQQDVSKTAHFRIEQYFQQSLVMPCLPAFRMLCGERLLRLDGAKMDGPQVVVLHETHPTWHARFVRCLMNLAGLHR